MFFASATTNPGNRRALLVCTPEPLENSNVSQISHGHRRPSSHVLLFFHLFFIFLQKKKKFFHFFCSFIFSFLCFSIFAFSFFIFSFVTFSFFISLVFFFSSFHFFVFSLFDFFHFFLLQIPFCLYVLLVETSFESFASQLLALTFVPPSIPIICPLLYWAFSDATSTPSDFCPIKMEKKNHFPMFSQTHRALGSLLLLLSFLASLPSFFSISFEKKLLTNC